MDDKERISLTKQRGGVREFKELYSAANVIEDIGLNKFAVFL